MLIRNTHNCDNNSCSMIKRLHTLNKKYNNFDIIYLVSPDVTNETPYIFRLYRLLLLSARLIPFRSSPDRGSLFIILIQIPDGFLLLEQSVCNILNIVADQLILA